MQKTLDNHAAARAARDELRARQARQDSKDEAPGVISTQEMYTPREICKRLKVGRGWIREAQQNGLPVLQTSRSFLISGDDLKEYLKTRKRMVQDGQGAQGTAASYETA